MAKGCPIAAARALLAAPWVSVVATLSVKLGFACCFAAFFFFGFDWITNDHYEQLETAYANWGIIYSRGGLVSVDAYDTMNMAFMWVPMLAAFFLALISRSLPSPATLPKVWSRFTAKLGSLLRFQLPPRRFFTWWCGGMTVIDALVLGIYLLFNIWYFQHYYIEYLKRFDALEAAGVVLYEPYSQLMLERVALIFGILAWPSLWLLFLPIPHNSLLQACLGLSYAEGIRYHRWFGHGTMVILTLHGCLYYLYWILKGDFWKYALDWGTHSSISYLAGTFSLVFGWVLWATSIEWCRRKYFEVFYRCHLVCFVGFTAFAFMHYFWSWSYFLPGLLLYAGDVVMRSGQLGSLTAAGVVPPASEKSLEDASVVTLDIQATKDFKACPLHDIFLLFPSISRWQWHPFTLAAVEKTPGGNTLRVHIKHYGKFTGQLIHQLAAKQYLPVRVRSPVGEDAWQHSWKEYHTLLFIAGGVGISPLLCIIKDLISCQRAAQLDGDKKADFKGPKITLVWTCRNVQEFEMMDADVLKASEDWLTLKLFSTAKTIEGNSPLAKLSPSTEGDLQKLSRENSSSDQSAKSSSSKDLTSSPSTIQKISSALVFPMSSPFSFKGAVTRLQPDVLNNFHAAVIMSLAFIGGLLGTYLGAAEFGERSAYYEEAGIDDNRYSWITGLVWFFCQGIMALGLPYALAILPVKIYKMWRFKGEDVLSSADFVDARANFVPCIACSNRVTSFDGEMSIEITRSRPDIPEELLAVASVAQETAKSIGLPSQVGVYVAGPKALNQGVMNAVGQANGCCGGTSMGTSFVLHKATADL